MVAHSREHESIAVDPVGIFRVEGHELVEHDVSRGCQAHGGTGVARIGLGSGIDLSSVLHSVSDPDIWFDLHTSNTALKSIFT